MDPALLDELGLRGVTSDDETAKKDLVGKNTEYSVRVFRIM